MRSPPAVGNLQLVITVADLLRSLVITVAGLNRSSHSRYLLLASDLSDLFPVAARTLIFHLECTRCECGADGLHFEDVALAVSRHCVRVDDATAGGVSAGPTDPHRVRARGAAGRRRSQSRLSMDRAYRPRPQSVPLLLLFGGFGPGTPHRRSGRRRHRALREVAREVDDPIIVLESIHVARMVLDKDDVDEPRLTGIATPASLDVRLQALRQL